MTENESTFSYQVGGSLNSDAPSYVSRSADAVFYEALRAKKFCYVFNSRQMGKSSLRVRTMQRLQAEGVVCVFIDLMGIGVQDVTAEQWYGGIVQSLVSSTQLSLSVGWRAWWRDRRDFLSPVQRLGLFIREILLKEIPQDIVIFIDEIDQVLSQCFCLDDFFGLIRFLWEQRTTIEAHQRLTFALLGVATPRSLVRANVPTPFNIGEAIELRGFTLEEAQPLLQGLQDTVNYPQEILRGILDWTDGQPFLTQKLCYLVRREVTRTKALNPASVEQALDLVRQVVQTQILENWETNDEPEHLRTIRDRLLNHKKWVGRLLGLYQNILEQGGIPFDGSPQQRELQLSGLVVREGGILRVYNPIYAALFDRPWVARQLQALRPYAEAIARWIQSPEEKFLLRDTALGDALTWSLGKSLSDADYQFLAASQDLAKREAQIALQDIKRANHLFWQAKHNARIAVLKSSLPRRWIPKVALGITALVLLLRLSGLLQGLEWQLWDRFFRWRGSQGLEPRVVLVTIDESDISHLGDWPLNDHLLATAIARIQAQSPQAIGLDLYRDLPVEPGSGELSQLFLSTPNLFGIEKSVNPTIGAHPILGRKQQVGFADQILDGDGILRRALLAVRPSQDKTNYSFAVQLALNYLGSRGISLKPTADPLRFQLGKAAFYPLRGNDGGYVRADFGGYQILLNFRGERDNFLTIPLQRVLDNQISPNFFSSRLVLLGSIAESSQDEFFTPYSHRWFNSPQTMPGVLIHAHIISQILGAALEGCSLLKPCPEPLEWCLIALTAFWGASLGWLCRSPKIKALALVSLATGCLGGAYWAFLHLGLWLPLLPSFIALLGATLLWHFIEYQQQEQLLFEKTLDELLGYCQDDPIPGRIALEYLYQAETLSHQATIRIKARL
jgi:CHASE2 domain-containing sensor protein